jgi:long-chain fatty acid transport protein
MLKNNRMVFLLIPFFINSLFASGFSIYEQGARATAMGGAFIAQADDPTAVFYNPAGYANLSGAHVSLGVTLIQTQFAFTGPTSYDSRKYTAAKEGLFAPSHFYFTYRLHNRISAGFGFFYLFGLGSEWGSESDPWYGRLLATKTGLKTYFFNPQIAVNILDNLSAGTGIEIVNGSLDIQRDLYFSPRNVFGKSSLTAETQGYGFNLGVQYFPMRQMRFGATYRSNVMLDFTDGDVKNDFPDMDSTINSEISRNYLFKTKGSVKIKLPDMLGFGLAYNFSENLSAEIDYLLIRWSSYDKLTLKVATPAGTTAIESPRHYRDCYSLRFGTQYRLDDSWLMRAGYTYDQHTVPDTYVEPSLPEGDRHNYTIGFGFNYSRITIDGAYHLLLQDDREISNSVNYFNGVYSGLANLFSISLGYTL